MPRSAAISSTQTLTRTSTTSVWKKINVDNVHRGISSCMSQPTRSWHRGYFRIVAVAWREDPKNHDRLFVKSLSFDPQR